MKQLCLAILAVLALGSILPKTFADASPCDFADWEPFKDEKCIKVIDETKNFEDAVKMCHQANSSVLISISSVEEQAFMVNLLFNKSKVVDAVWLGAKYNPGVTKFKWT